MLKITQTVVRYSKSTTGAQNLIRYNNFSSVPITVAVGNVENDVNTEPVVNLKKKANINAEITYSAKKPNSLVAAAFASLKNEKLSTEIKTPFTDDRISKATTVSDLLSISEGSGVSRRLALKVVSVLADWSTSGKTQLSDYETDPRFIRLCKILTKGNFNDKKTLIKGHSEDLSTVLNVTADDEAAKLITSISLPQMVKVMSTLARKKRRSTPLLRSLAFNITRSSEHLDLKQCADILYGASSLNFIDENLVQKVCSDVCIGVTDDLKSSSVIGSILTSLGLLRYKNTEILDTLSGWIVKNHQICRSQDIFSLIITLANLNHQPCNSEHVYEVLIPHLRSAEANKITAWLDVVWSLVVLNKANQKHIASVLNYDFLKKIEEDANLNISSKLKILNIDYACKFLLRDYSGPRLSPNSSIRNVTVLRTKDKEILISSLQDSLSNLINPQTYLKTNIDTGMGFYIDIELELDKKGNPVPIHVTKDSSNHFKVAILGYDFHDMCRGRPERTGINALSLRLLEAQGYRTLSVPYTEFHPKDKLVNRVKYLETKLKSLTLL